MRPLYLEEGLPDLSNLWYSVLIFFECFTITMNSSLIDTSSIFASAMFSMLNHSDLQTRLECALKNPEKPRGLTRYDWTNSSKIKVQGQENNNRSEKRNPMRSLEIQCRKSQFEFSRKSEKTTQWTNCKQYKLRGYWCKDCQTISDHAGSHSMLSVPRLVWDFGKGFLREKREKPHWKIDK